MKLLQNYYETITKLLQNYYKTITKLLQNYCPNIAHPCKYEEIHSVSQLYSVVL